MHPPRKRGRSSCCLGMSVVVAALEVCTESFCVLVIPRRLPKAGAEGASP
jgi:hypothetical protein